jgi:prolyl-tRNA editing enzyme YbaK/EbsC (Cys-tRNA(Pro) deacylase)
MTSAGAPNAPSPPPDLRRWLAGAGLTWRVVAHPPAVSAAAEAAALHQPPELVAKTVVLRAAGELVSVVIPASERLSPDKLVRVLRTSDVALAHEDDILRAAPPYELGALPPIGPCVPRLAILDQRLLTYGHVLCAAGDRSLSLVLDPEDLVRVSNPVVADVCADRSSVHQEVTAR